MRAFKGVSEDITVIEEPSDGELVLEGRIHADHFGKVQKQTFLLVLLSGFLFLLLFALLLLLLLITLLVVFSLLALLSQVFRVILQLRQCLFIVADLELIHIVEDLNQPVQVFFLVQVQNDIVTLFLLSSTPCWALKPRLKLTLLALSEYGMDFST